MSQYEKVEFLSFFDVRASKWLQNGPEYCIQIDVVMLGVNL